MRPTPSEPRRRFAGGLLALGLLPWAAQAQRMFSAAEIVEKNAAARGGLQAWRAVGTMAWAGHAEVGSAPGRQLAFMLEQKRPDKTRFEIDYQGQKSVRIFDGSAGWKLRNAANGRLEASAYDEDELRFAHGAQVIEGPLMDYVAKGSVVSLAGTGEVDGRRAYVLDVKLPSGGKHLVWVDAQNFLELRHDREVRGKSGESGMVTVLMRDYREFAGLQIPTTIETAGTAQRPAHKLVIERVALNPELDDSMFAKPEVHATRRRSVTVDTRSAAAEGARSAAPR
jgi:outer membrane lipoprotein-sorting protein